jgi:hypothetical protein
MLLRYFFGLFFLLILPNFSWSQLWEAYIQSTGTGMNEGIGVHLMEEGSIIYGGNFRNTFSFQSQSLNGESMQRGVVGKLFPDKSTAWVREFRSSQSVFLRSISVNGPAIAVAGEFSDTLFIGQDTLINSFQKGMFISFLDTNGNYYYTLNPDVNSASVNAVHFDEDGFVYATGDFFLHFNFDAYTLNSPNGMSFYLFKYDAYNQHLEWLVNSAGTGTYGKGVAKDQFGNVYAAGSYGNDTSFENETLPDANGAHNAFLVSYSNQGDLNWIRTMTGNGQIHGVDVKVNDEREVFFAGDFEFMIDSLGSVLTTSGVSNTFITKFTDSGEQIWIERIGGDDQDRPTALAIDSAGSPILLLNTAQSTSIGNIAVNSFGFKEPLLVKLHQQNGSLIWHQRITADAVSGVAYGSDIHLVDDRIVVTGRNVSGIQFGNDLFSAPNFSELFIAYFTDTLYAELIEEPNTTGLGSVTTMNDVYVFPNPSNSVFKVKTPDSITNWEVSVYELSGKLVLHETFHSSWFEFGEELRPGFYLLRMENGEFSYDQKIAKI